MSLLSNYKENKKMVVLCDTCGIEHSGTIPLQLSRDLITGIDRIISTNKALRSFVVLPRAESERNTNIDYVFFQTHKKHRIIISDGVIKNEIYDSQWRQ